MNKVGSLNYWVVNRVLSALLGGYVFTWGFSSLGIAGLAALGVDFHEAETGVLMLAFLVFLGVFLWAFASSSVARVWAVLAGGGVLMTLSAWLIQQSMLS
ncbi:iron uptake protein [Limnobacter sp.]|uniref:iron uptake protein n=1 Tax=Limnobacter sp. TaxID=2003368 RepID=UPI0027363FE9|nr:iron uptake protein [Limnobacter sp.]MDP3272124.1 iron uptake protein [Limnobacter sp.]